MPIAVLSEYTEKEYEPFDPYSRFHPAMPISVCFSDTALCTLGKISPRFFLSVDPFCGSALFSGKAAMLHEKVSAIP
ncbi:MAG TPA: hypothetical protein H9674_00615 [Firmicutes bacterium]|nr:hypothetical protein [Bacillota bacterium]